MRKRVYEITIKKNQIKIPEEVLKVLQMNDLETVKLVLSNDCFLVLKESTLSEYLKKQKN